MELLTQQDIVIFEKHKHLYSTIERAGFCRNFTKEVYNELSDLYIRFIGKHSYTHWCGECRFDLVKYLYQWYNKQGVQLPSQEEQGDLIKQEPSKQEQPIQQPKKRGRPKRDANKTM